MNLSSIENGNVQFLILHVKFGHHTLDNNIKFPHVTDLPTKWGHLNIVWLHSFEFQISILKMMIVYMFFLIDCCIVNIRNIWLFGENFKSCLSPNQAASLRLLNSATVGSFEPGQVFIWW